MKSTHLIWKQLDVLENNRVKLLNFIGRLDPDKIRNHPAKGWSIMQVMRHIQASEMSSISYINKKKLAGEELKKVELNPKVYLFLINLAFRIGFKFKAPAILKDPEDSSLEELIVDWDKTRSEMRELLNEYPDVWEMKAVYRHPFAGMLGISDAIRFFNIHQNQHIRQVRRIATHL